MKKRFISMTLTLCIVVSIFSGCVPKATSKTSSTSVAETQNFNPKGLPILKEPQSFTLTAITAKNKNFKELKFFKDLEASTNVQINWNMNSGEGWPEKKSLLFAGGDLPDAFYGRAILNDTEIIKYASQKLFIPLNKLIEEYAPNLSKVLNDNPKYLAQITAPDGNIYALPSINELAPVTHSKFFINKKWLDKLKMPVPETLGDFEKTLQAFKDNDMNGNGDKNDEIPFSFHHNDVQQGLYGLFGSFGQSDVMTHFIVKDGKVVYTAMTEPYKAAIKYFNSLYTKGLIDQEGFTQDFNVYVSKVQNPDKICGGFLGWSRNSTGGPNKEDYIAVAPLKGADGKQIWNSVDAKLVSKGSFAITKNAKNPEILMRWIDESYEPERSLQVDQGLLGVTIEKTSEGRYKYLPIPEGKNFDVQIHDYSPGNSGVSALVSSVIKNLDLNANLKERAELDEFYKPYTVALDELFPNVFFTVDELEKISALKTDIEAYVDKNYAGWISGGGIDKGWDAYISKLNDMKVDDYIKLHQQAYDRYIKSIK